MLPACGYGVEEKDSHGGIGLGRGTRLKSLQYLYNHGQQTLCALVLLIYPEVSSGKTKWAFFFQEKLTFSLAAGWSLAQ